MFGFNNAFFIRREYTNAKNFSILLCHLTAMTTMTGFTPKSYEIYKSSHSQNSRNNSSEYAQEFCHKRSYSYSEANRN